MIEHMFEMSEHGRGSLEAALERVAGEDRSGWSAGAHTARLRELLEARRRIEVEVLRCVGEWDARGAWSADGALGPTPWLAHWGGLPRADAARLVATARLARRHDTTGKALAAGDVHPAHVHTIARAVRRHEGRYPEHEEVLLDAARALHPDQFALAARRWRSIADDLGPARPPDAPGEAGAAGAAGFAPADDAAGGPVGDGGDGDDGGPAGDATAGDAAAGGVPTAFGAGATSSADDDFEPELWVSPTFRGRVVVNGELDAEGGAILVAALRQHEQPDRDPTCRRSAAARRADALVALASGAARPRLSLSVTVDVATLAGRAPTDLRTTRCDLDPVGPVPLATVQRLACDAAIERVVQRADGEVLDLGRRTRLVAPAQRRALVARDGGCVFPSCDRPHQWCDAHHLVPWTHGGPTDLRNLALLCRRHHTLCHEGRWRLHRAPDGTWHAIPP